MLPDQLHAKLGESRCPYRLILRPRRRRRRRPQRPQVALDRFRAMLSSLCSRQHQEAVGSAVVRHSSSPFSLPSQHRILAREQEGKGGMLDTGGERHR
eukprot:363403-Chlamydomonas_euryale.AAC.3